MKYLTTMKPTQAQLDAERVFRMIVQMNPRNTNRAGYVEVGPGMFAELQEVAARILAGTNN